MKAINSGGSKTHFQSNFGSIKGQITVFIILGLVIMAVFGIVIYTTDMFVTQTNESYVNSLSAMQGTDSVQSYIESCLDQSTREAIQITLKNGGYYSSISSLNLEYYSDENELLELPFYYYQGNSQIPSVESFETQVAIGTTELFEKCIDDFSAFKELGYTIESSRAVIDIEFSDASIIELYYPIILSIQEDATEFDYFTLYYPFDLREILDEVNSYLEKQSSEESGFFSVGYLSQAAYFSGYDFYYNFPQLDSDDIAESNTQNTVLLNFAFDNTLWDNPLNLNFAVDIGSEEESSNGIFSEFESDLESSLTESLSDLSVEEQSKEAKILTWDITNSGLSYYKLPVSADYYTLEPELEGMLVDDDGIISLDSGSFINNNYLMYVHATSYYESNSIDFDASDDTEETITRESTISYPLILNIQVDYDGLFPVFDTIPDQRVIVGEQFSYTVTLENPSDFDIFELSSSFMQIDETTGEISLLATTDLIGKHGAKVEAYNNEGHNWIIFSVEVIAK
jgi:hypothetical protein